MEQLLDSDRLLFGGDFGVIVPQAQLSETGKDRSAKSSASEPEQYENAKPIYKVALVSSEETLARSDFSGREPKKRQGKERTKQKT